MCERECAIVRDSSGDVLDCPNCPYADVPETKKIIISVEVITVDEPAVSVAVTK